MTGMEAIMVARNGAPLVIGKGHNTICVSSDVQPFYGICSQVAYINDGDVLSVTPEGIKAGEKYQIPSFSILEGTYEEQDPGVFEDLMLKEIFDQPVSLTNVLSGRVSSDGLRVELGGLDLNPEEINSLERINLVACGTAFFAAKIGARIIRKHSDITVEAFRGSEFPARKVCGPNTLTVGISQSGETKDTLDALQEARIAGSNITSFCNVIGSTIPRLTGNGAYLYAGPEYAVASTKVFTNMVAIILLFSLSFSKMSSGERTSIVQDLRELPNKIALFLRESEGSLDEAVSLLESASSAIFIGRGISAPLVEEGALKMMEVAYLPCLAYPGGELKHGPIALIEEGTPVIAVAPSCDELALMESSIRECKARGAKVILITDNEGPINEFADVILQTQSSIEETSPIVNVIPLQLLAYKLGKIKGLNVDRPRNLAKSVTVV
jgi:glucosamine--fructose-6-phosphate aminotransferase (isomerizing)